MYPELSLAQARELCADARKVLRSGVDPNQAKVSAPIEQPEVDPNTFEALALQWLVKMEASRTAKVQGWLDHDLFSFIGVMPVAAIKPRDIWA